MADKNPDSTLAIPVLMEATLFAAEKHRGQRRKDADRTPYINHPIMVVNLMANVGGITDIEALQAGMLHDTVEDTDATAEEIETNFGFAVRTLVMEVTDDKALDKQERKRRQIEKAPGLSPRAKAIKIADKIANLNDMLRAPPVGWSVDRLRQYVAWSDRVVAGCRGLSDELDELYDRTTLAASEALG